MRPIYSLSYLTFSCLVISCAASKTVGIQNGGINSGDNNVVNATSRNSRYSSSKTDGQSTLVFNGKNNIINIDLTDSDIASFNTKTVTIIEGDNNNITSIIRKCVLTYKGRTDTLLIKGNQLKIDFTADHVTALIEGPGHNGEITSSTTPDNFHGPEWQVADEHKAEETVLVQPLGEYLPLPQAFAYYQKQVQDGNYQACYILGRFFDNLTFDTQADITKAIVYYEMAARHNQPDAAFRLGYIYEVGNFEFEQVAINRLKAQYYYTLAAKNGSEQAQEKLKLWGE